LTVGTAGHVDHGKTSLVRALTGVDTDRLPEERARGLTIVLGYAPLELPSGRRLSVVDVPGHERFVRTMVAGATGVDAFLMVVAADDGVMPQTREHAVALAALGVDAGVVAITKADVADPARAGAQSADLLPGCELVACSSRTGLGLAELRAALERLAGQVTSRAVRGGPVRLHVDRVFTVVGRGTVVTGTLWTGTVEEGEALELLRVGRGGMRVRARGIQVHDESVSRAEAGQRVAVNLLGVRVADVRRGDVIATPDTLRETRVLDCRLELRDGRHGERVQVHHGARNVSGRLAMLEEATGLWQLRLEAPLFALDGDRLLVRRLAPPDTLGGGVVLDGHASRHGARPEILDRLRDLARGETRSSAPVRTTTPHPPATPVRRPVSSAAVAALEARLRAAGPGLLSEAQIAAEQDALRALQADGRAVRVSGRLYAHAEVAARLRARIVELLEREGPLGLAAVRDALGLSRRSTQAFLEHLDGQRVTRRLPDDRRALLHRRAATKAPA